MKGADDTGSGFLARWARRKEQARGGAESAAEPTAPAVELQTSAGAAVATVATVAANAEPASVSQARAVEPPPTLADVALLTRDSDYARFIGADVDNGVTQAAMKKLFADPHFNVMDGLDTYIDDYGKPDPIPLAMLRQMNQSKFLRLFDDEDEDPAEPITGATPESLSPPDDHADLRLQPDDAAEQPGPDPGAGA